MRGLLIAAPTTPPDAAGGAPDVVAVPSDADPAPRPGFDLDAGWRLHGSVALRPEPFGALAYHFGTRRLSFIKDRDLLAVVRALGDHPTARDACAAAGIADARVPAFARALGTLAGSQMIERA